MAGSRTSLKLYVNSELNAIPASLSQYALQMWLRRLEMCVASAGMYSEGMQKFRRLEMCLASAGMYSEGMEKFRRVELCVANAGMYSEGMQKFDGGMFTGFRFTSLVTGLWGWPSYYLSAVTKHRAF